MKKLKTFFRRPRAGSGRAVFWSKSGKILGTDNSMYLYPIALKSLPVNLTYILHCFPKAIFDFLYFSRDIGLQIYLNHSKIWRKNENRYKKTKK